MYVLMSLTSQVPFYTPGPSFVIRVSYVHAKCHWRLLCQKLRIQLELFSVDTSNLSPAVL
jgi:hypothetical protein